MRIEAKMSKEKKRQRKPRGFSKRLNILMAFGRNPLTSSSISSCTFLTVRDL